MADANYGADPSAEALGIIVEEAADGFARTRLEMKAQHLNGHETGHGGIIFMLADCAFAAACNSRGVDTVGTHCSISYHAPVTLGDVLVADCSETSLSGRVGEKSARRNHRTFPRHFQGAAKN